MTLSNVKLDFCFHAECIPVRVFWIKKRAHVGILILESLLRIDKLKSDSDLNSDPRFDVESVWQIPN